jgi:hypothetical protein
MKIPTTKILATSGLLEAQSQCTARLRQYSRWYSLPPKKQTVWRQSHRTNSAQ